MVNLADKVLSGDKRAAARLMSYADNRASGYLAAMSKIWLHAGRAHIIGITGSPGAGKSTLTDALISDYRANGQTVGVVAIDPSSPFSGGAILGDRIRMSGHVMDEGVFIRSVATRGNLGGLSVSAMDIAAIMDAMGMDVVIIETVGVGQDEVEIASVADTCIVVTMPGTGDDIQAIKAGILEVADIFAVNKADLDGADRTVRDLEMMMELSSHRALWTPPIVKTVAARKEGIKELAEKINDHKFFGLASLKEQKKQARLYHAAVSFIKERIMTNYFSPEKLKYAMMLSGGDPYVAVKQIWMDIINEEKF